MSIWILSQHSIEHYENDRLLKAFSNLKLNAKLMNPDQFDIIVNRHNRKSVRYNNTQITLPKIVLNRTGSGTNYFTSAVIRQLEKLSVTTVNSIDGINNVKDKLLAHQILSQNNIPTPKTMLVKFPVSSSLVEGEIGFPCVVKVLQGSYGRGVYLCENKKLFEDLMGLIDGLGLKKIMIVQEFIDNSKGTDLRVWVLGNRVIGAMKRTGPQGDFRANITGGGTGEAFEVTEEIETLCIKTARALGLDIAGIDLLFDNDGFKVCEANSAPGFEGFETYVKVNVAEQIAEYIEARLKI